jgi:hypothetical protein
MNTGTHVTLWVRNVLGSIEELTHERQGSRTVGRFLRAVSFCRGATLTRVCSWAWALVHSLLFVLWFRTCRQHSQSPNLLDFVSWRVSKLSTPIDADLKDAKV